MATRRRLAHRRLLLLVERGTTKTKLWMPNGHARAGSPRDDRGPVARLAPQTGDGKCPFAALLAFGSRLISRAESMREAGGKPAVVCVKTDNKRFRFAGCFLRERRDSNPRPPA